MAILTTMTINGYKRKIENKQTITISREDK